MVQIGLTPIRQDHPLYACIKDYIKTWAQLGQSLGYPDQIRRPPCRFPRCSGGMEVSSGFMACGTCSKAVYCSAGCQQADWEFDAAPHRDTCGNN
ncbi:hypothetical protein BDV93DRAFT_609809 [Ceratobasidium sp. AG-I]|nr:hypothetical protein BDV93DRAFT_609809 [Ceratobasidium sp. AG-I]